MYTVCEYLKTCVQAVYVAHIFKPVKFLFSFISDYDNESEEKDIKDCTVFLFNDTEGKFDL